MLYTLRRFSQSEVAEERLRIIKFYEKYGEKATKEAFEVERKLISKWRKRLKDGGSSLSALIPLLTRPHSVRHSIIPQEIISLSSI